MVRYISTMSFASGSSEALAAGYSRSSVTDADSAFLTNFRTLVSILFVYFVTLCGSLTDYQFGDRLQLHVRRALVNRANLRVAPVFPNRIIFHVSVTAVQLH